MRVFGTLQASSPGEALALNSYARHQRASSYGLYGLQVATVHFLEALLKHGTFDEYHFFVPREHIRSDGRIASECLMEAETDPRVKARPIDTLEGALRTCDYQVFHRPEGPDIASWIGFRNHVGAHSVPMTCITHTLSYPSLCSAYAMLLLARPCSWDSIICSAQSAKTVLERLLASISAEMASELHVDIPYTGRLDVIPLGVDTDVFLPREKSAAREQLSLPRDKRIVLWFGRFSHFDKADLRPLLIAFRMALDQMRDKDMVLLLVGDDARYSYSSSIEAFGEELGIASRVIIRKNPSLAAGPLFYSAADVFVCPSDNVQETFGQTVVEAMASGLPVICSDWDGLRSTVRDGRTGLLVPTYSTCCDSRVTNYAGLESWRHGHLHLGQATCVDVRPLAHAIRALAEDHDRRKALGVQAREEALRTYSWQAVIARYEILWNELKAAARTSHSGTLARGCWFHPKYSHVFGAYPTSVLTNDARVRRDEAPDWLPDPVTCLELYPELRGVIRPHLVTWLMHAIGSEISVGELVTSAEQQFALGAECVNWHLLVLLKYGYIQLTP